MEIALVNFSESVCLNIYIYGVLAVCKLSIMSNEESSSQKYRARLAAILSFENCIGELTICN